MFGLRRRQLGGEFEEAVWVVISGSSGRFCLWVFKPVHVFDFSVPGGFLPSPFYYRLFCGLLRGLCNKDTIWALKNICFKHKSEIVFLSETKQKKRYLEKIRMKMKLENAFYVEPVGITGGLALWWSSNVKLAVLQYDKNFIDTMISINRESEWFRTFIYAPL
ncbi:hypothetical protein V6N11_076766 [Hibiscus sabdariffa]|uniref:Uncharacterized protein n=1 Tax=Hibiscus sabdariffa TaxID=183260 RepID=A0ABR2P9F2_9ROSI